MSVSLPLLHLGVATVCVAAAGAALRGGRQGRTKWLLAAWCAATAVWALAAALRPEPSLDGIVGALDLARAALGILLLAHLQRRENPDAGSRWPLAWVAAAGVLGLLSQWPGPALPTLSSPALLGRLGLAVLIVTAAENTYRNAGEAARWHVNLPCIALGGLGVLDMVAYADAVLARAFSPALLDARFVLAAMAAPLLAIAALRDRRWRPGPLISRDAVFHGAALVVSGAFLIGVGTVGEALRQFGAGWGEAARASLIAGGAMAVLVAVASRSARSRVRRLLVDPFFRSRFDYRQEWMRCIAALSAPEGGSPAHIRAVRAVADAVDSPGGVLLLCEAGEATPRWAGSWNAPEAPIPPPEFKELAKALGTDGRVLVLTATEPAAPALVAAFGPLWLAVPLLHHREGLVGAVLLAPPRASFALDGEAFALLRALGREVALFLAERRAAQRLADARKVQDYAARFAFVAHDVKTVSGGLKLLLGNAEDNLHDPEFQRDMLVTVRAATTRIDSLIARLRQPGAEAIAAQGVVHDPMARLRAIAAARPTAVLVDDDARPVASRAAVAMVPEAFDAAVGHLLDNAVEASTPGDPVRLQLGIAEGRPVLDIVDQGSGMAPAFVHDELFSPLSTSKAGGNGIGAWQARELLRRAGGDLTVLSRPGVGTTMRLLLPLHGMPAGSTELARA